MDISIIFLVLSSAIGLPTNIVSTILNAKLSTNKTKRILLFINLITLALYIGALVNCILGISVEYVCAWVGMGLGIGAIVFGVVSLATSIIIRIMPKKIRKSKPKANKKASNYIQELKDLKELLDSGAITQIEFDKKKKDILERR